MKIYLDSADINEVKKVNELGILDGVTTNPSLIVKTGRTYEETLKEISTILGTRPVSAELVTTTYEDMIKEANELAKINANIVIKVPITKVGIKVIKDLEKDSRLRLQLKGVRTNATLCFSPLQALLVAKVGGSYVSPFVGRLDDICEEGMALIANIKQIYMNYSFDTEIIVASIRHPLHLLNSARLGADIVTIPYKVIEQMFKHPKTDEGIERFLNDYEKIPK